MNDVPFGFWWEMNGVPPPLRMRPPSIAGANGAMETHRAQCDRHADGTTAVVDGAWVPTTAGEATLRSGCGDAVTSALAEVHARGASVAASVRRGPQRCLVCCSA